MISTLSADDILRKTHAVGQYYGFTPLTSLPPAPRGKGVKKFEYPESLAGVTLDPVAEIVASFLKQCRERALAPSLRTPLFLWHTNIAPGRPTPKKIIIQFHALGNDRAIADTLVIRALSALVRDLTGSEPSVHVNSMGDKETRARYARELGNFFKKRGANLSENCATCARRDVFEAAELAIAESFAEDLPAPTDHLSDQSRKRFEEFLEYLEQTETPYELAHTLISRGASWSETCFELFSGDERVAWGSRYGDLAKHFFKAPPIPALGAVLQMTSASNATAKAPHTTRLRFAFVHIGDEAKQLALALAEDFKKARLPLAQDIGVESLTEQMYLAERKNPPYLLIMGRKEALEHSAILRNRETQEETVLPLAGLIERLRAVV